MKSMKSPDKLTAIVKALRNLTPEERQQALERAKLQRDICKALGYRDGVNLSLLIEAIEGLSKSELAEALGATPGEHSARQPRGELLQALLNATPEDFIEVLGLFPKLISYEPCVSIDGSGVGVEVGGETFKGLTFAEALTAWRELERSPEIVTSDAEPFSLSGAPVDFSFEPVEEVAHAAFVVSREGSDWSSPSEWKIPAGIDVDNVTATDYVEILKANGFVDARFDRSGSIDHGLHVDDPRRQVKMFLFKAGE